MGGTCSPPPAVTAPPGAPRLLFCLAVSCGGMGEIVDWKHIADWHLRAFNDPPHVVPHVIVRFCFPPPSFLVLHELGGGFFLCIVSLTAG